MGDDSAPVYGPALLASTVLAELGAAIDRCEVAGRMMRSTTATEDDIDSTVSDSIAHALVSIAASLAIISKANEIESPDIMARLWADGYHTGRADEAGGLPLDHRAIPRS